MPTVPEAQAQPANAGRCSATIYPIDYEARTIEVAKKLLDDIPECTDARYQVRFLGGAPVLIMSFPRFELALGVIPAFALRLVTISQSEPLRAGAVLEGDRLRRALRTNLETYMYRHGIRVPVEFES
jgi:hypothetical protein